MRASTLHPRGRDRPRPRLIIDLIPRRAPRFATSRRRENQETEAQFRGHRGPARFDEFKSLPDFPIIQ